MNVPRELVEEMLGDGPGHPYGLRQVARYLSQEGAGIMAKRVEWYADQLEKLSQEEEPDVSHGA